MPRKPEPTARRDGSPLPRDLIRRGRTLAVPYRPDDWWRITAEIESEPESAGTDPPSTFFHFEMTLMRPDPLILARLKSGSGGLRKADWWTFEFEGDPALVRRERAIMMLTRSAFASDEPDENRRELRLWIALHCAARSSPVLSRSARDDAPGDDAPEIEPRRHNSLAGISGEKAAAILARDLDCDLALVVSTLKSYLPFLTALECLPDEKVSRQAIDRALGIR